MHVLGFRTFDSMDECCVFSVFSPLHPQGFGKCLGEETIFKAYKNLSIKHSERNCYKRRTFCMESNWARYRKPLAFTAQVIRSAASSMLFSLKIPIGDS